mgnify:CR=1 FL=1
MPPTSLTAQPSEPLRAIHWILLAALLCAGAALRLWGIDHGQPHTRERDAHMAYHAQLLREGYQPPDPHNNDNQYPSLLPWVLSLTPGPAPAAPSASLDEHLDAASALFVQSRIEMALVSVSAIALTFALARSFMSNAWALLAAGLMASSFLTQYFAQQARPHAAVSAIYLAAVLACMRLAKRPTLFSYALATSACALAIGSLHSGLATLAPLVVACLFAALYVVHEPASRLYRRLLAAPVLAALTCALAFPLFYRYLFRDRTDTDFDRVVFDGTHLVWGDHRVGLVDFAGGGSLIVLRTLWFNDPALLVLLALAVAVAVARKLPIYRPYERWSDFWVAFAFAGPYLLLIALFARTYERFVLPLVPYFAVFASWGLAHLAGRGAGARKLASAVAAAALLFSAISVTRLAWLRAQPDSLELAAQWITSQLDPNSDRVYCVPTMDLPLARSDDSLFPSDKRPPGRHSRWGVYQTQLGPGVLPVPRWDVRYIAPRPDLGYPFAKLESDPQGFLRALGAGYYVIDASRMPARPLFTDLPRLLTELGGERVARFEPNDDDFGRGWSLPYEDEQIEGWPNVVRRVLGARCVGPVVEIYRVP